MEIDHKTINKCWPYYLEIIHPMYAVDKYKKYMDQEIAISVGSGNGAFEKFLNILYDIKIICVGPLIQQKKCRWGLKLNYDSIENVIKDDITLIGKNLILIAPMTTVQDKIGYDIEAIKLLQPQKIFMIVDMAGSSGSSSIIKSIKKKRKNIIKFDEDNIYKVSKQKTRRPTNKDKKKRKKIRLLILDKINIFDNYIIL